MLFWRLHIANEVKRNVPRLLNVLCHTESQGSDTSTKQQNNSSEPASEFSSFNISLKLFGITVSKLLLDGIRKAKKILAKCLFQKSS